MQRQREIRHEQERRGDLEQRKKNRLSRPSSASAGSGVAAIRDSRGRAEEARHRRVEAALTAFRRRVSDRSLNKLFLQFDGDRDGHLEAVEVQNMLSTFGISLSAGDCASLWERYDLNNDSRLQYGELAQMMWGDYKEEGILHTPTVLQELQRFEEEAAADSAELRENLIRSLQPPDLPPLTAAEGLAMMREKYAGECGDKYSLRKLFLEWDRNGDDGISRGELHTVLQRAGISLPVPAFGALFDEMDKKGDGKIDHKELRDALFPSSDAAGKASLQRLLLPGEVLPTGAGGRKRETKNGGEQQQQQHQRRQRRQKQKQKDEQQQQQQQQQQKQAQAPTKRNPWHRTRPVITRFSARPRRIPGATGARVLGQVTGSPGWCPSSARYRRASSEIGAGGAAVGSRGSSGRDVVVSGTITQSDALEMRQRQAKRLFVRQKLQSERDDRSRLARSREAQREAEIQQGRARQKIKYYQALRQRVSAVDKSLLGKRMITPRHLQAKDKGLYGAKAAPFDLHDFM